jgi:hypothetical protein
MPLIRLPSDVKSSLRGESDMSRLWLSLWKRYIGKLVTSDVRKTLLKTSYGRVYMGSPSIRLIECFEF